MVEMVKEWLKSGERVVKESWKRSTILVKKLGKSAERAGKEGCKNILKLWERKNILQESKWSDIRIVNYCWMGPEIVMK